MGFYTIGSYKFHKDQANGSKGEILACKVLKGDFGDFEVMDGYFPDYDLKGRITVEVKTDLFSRKSNNVALEFENIKGEDCGINRTKADKYFIICFDKDMSLVIEGIKHVGWWVGCLIDSSVLKELCEQEFRRTIIGGDRMAIKMKLIPINVIEQYTEKIYPIKSNQCNLYA